LTKLDIFQNGTNSSDRNWTCKQSVLQVNGGWIDPAQLLNRYRFLINDQLARRSWQVREIPARRELRLGDEEREDLSEIATIATLEIVRVCFGQLRGMAHFGQLAR
jgi:hypothetical protein